MPLLRRMDADKSGTISLAEFRAMERNACLLLMPVFTLQHDLRAKCLGHRYWEHATVLRERAIQDADLAAVHYALYNKGKRLRRMVQAAKAAVAVDFRQL
jgi:hypothetical protein